MECYLEFKNLIQSNKEEILFLCIGTDRSTGDSLGPMVGTMLSEEGYNVLGTIDNPVHALNIEQTVESINELYPDYTIVAIDACLGKASNVGKIMIHNEPIKPGMALGKELCSVGDISILGIVNISGYMEFQILQNTRLSLVMKMSSAIYSLIKECVPLPSLPAVNIDFLKGTGDTKVTIEVRKTSKKSTTKKLSGA